MKKIKLIAIVCLILTSNIAFSQIKIIAHRGYWNTAGSAQNSLVALHKAHEIGIYGSEFDVTATLDGIAIVNHDDQIQGYTIEKTDYNTLRNLKLNNGEILPTLEQYLVHGKSIKETKLILEIKPHKTKEAENRAVGIITAMVKSMDMEAQIEYISFSMNICEELRKAVPNAIISYLGGEVSPSEIKAKGLSGIDYHYSVLQKNPEWVKECQKLGLTVNVWTVNNEDVMREMIKMQVDYITTDNPVLLSKILTDIKDK